MNGPAYQRWYENGQKKIEEWSLNDRYHREDGPSIQWWYENGQKWIELWSLNGKRHREDGRPEEQLALYNAENYNL